MIDESKLNIVGRVQKEDHLAFPIGVAADLISISYTSMWREIKRRKIFPTKTLRVITKEELLRYLREETQLATRKQRVPRSQYQPVTQTAA